MSKLAKPSRLLAKCPGDVTFFEAATALAFLLFAEEAADFVLLETGLGGRFDATNVIPVPKAAVITPIAVDHTEYLGKNLSSIAAEKAGIIKPGGKVVIAPQSEAVLETLASALRQKRAEAFICGRDWWLEGGALSPQGAGDNLEPLPAWGASVRQCGLRRGGGRLGPRDAAASHSRRNRFGPLARQTAAPHAPRTKRGRSDLGAVGGRRPQSSRGRSPLRQPPGLG